MSQPKIIEESCGLDSARMATVRTSRGDEFVINLDEAAKALAESFSDYRNERHFGWTIMDRWFRDEWLRLRQRAVAPLSDHQSGAASSEVVSDSGLSTKAAEARS